MWRLFLLEEKQKKSILKEDSVLWSPPLNETCEKKLSIWKSFCQKLEIHITYGLAPFFLGNNSQFQPLPASLSCLHKAYDDVFCIFYCHFTQQDKRIFSSYTLKKSWSFFLFGSYWLLWKKIVVLWNIAYHFSLLFYIAVLEKGNLKSILQEKAFDNK